MGWCESRKQTCPVTSLTTLLPQGATITALATCVKIGLFKHLAKDGGSPKTAVSLAEAIGINPTVLSEWSTTMDAT